METAQPSAWSPLKLEQYRLPPEYLTFTPELVPTQVFLGPGALDHLAQVMDALRARLRGRGVLVVMGAAPKASPIYRQVLRACSERDAQFVRTPPALLSAESCAQMLGEIDARDVGLVVGLGGGRALDAAKLLRAALETGASPAALAGGARCAPERRGVALIAIPTTCGTGAEVTRYATLWDVQGARKRSVSDIALCPDVAMVDARLLASLPPAIMRDTALDALAHALESAWSVGASQESLALSLQSAAAMLSVLRALAARAVDAAVIEKAARGACAAGLAISVAGTTLAHAVSYGLTVKGGVPHGLACSLLLPELLLGNAQVSREDCADARGPEHVRWRIQALCQLIAGCDQPERAAQELRELLAGLGVSSAELLRGFDCAALAEAACGYERAANNPRRFSHAQIAQLIQIAAAS